MDSSNIDKITVAATLRRDWIRLDASVTALAIQVSFNYGGGGEKVRAFLQTSIDGGETAIDVACFEFSNKTKKLAAQVMRGGDATDVFEVKDLSLEGGKVNHFIGDMIRIVIDSKGVYQDGTFVGAYCVPIGA